MTFCPPVLEFNKPGHATVVPAGLIVTERDCHTRLLSPRRFSSAAAQTRRCELQHVSVKANTWERGGVKVDSWWGEKWLFYTPIRSHFYQQRCCQWSIKTYSVFFICGGHKGQLLKRLRVVFKHQYITHWLIKSMWSLEVIRGTVLLFIYIKTANPISPLPSCCDSRFQPTLLAISVYG